MKPSAAFGLDQNLEQEQTEAMERIGNDFITFQSFFVSSAISCSKKIAKVANISIVSSTDETRPYHFIMTMFPL